MWFVYSTRVIFSCSKNKRAGMFISPACQSLTLQQTGAPAQAPEDTRQEERLQQHQQFSLGGLTHMYRATSAHVLTRHCNTATVQTAQPGLQHRLCLFTTYSCCLISLLPTFTCFVYLSLQTRHCSACIKSQLAF